MRKWGRGSVVTRKSKHGTRYSVKYRNPEGKQKWGGTYDTRQEAQKELNRLNTEMDNGTYRDRNPITVEAFGKKWLAGRVSIEGATESAYRSVFKRQIVPRVGGVVLADLTLEHCQGFVAGMLTDGLKTKTVRNAVALLRAILTGEESASAMRLRYIATDPTLGLELPKIRKREIMPPTQEQVWGLIDAAKEVSANAHAATFLDAHTGLRRGEMLALQFADVDWFAKELVIRRAVKKRKGTDGAHKWEWFIGAVKSQAGHRRIGLTPNAVQFLAELKRAAKDPDGLVIPGDGGNFIDPDVFDAEVFGPVAEKAGLKGMRFHDLRHFFASALIAQGESAVYVKEQLGHSSTQVTLDTYGHLFPGAHEAASEKFDAGMKRAQTAVRTEAKREERRAQ